MQKITTYFVTIALLFVTHTAKAEIRYNTLIDDAKVISQFKKHISQTYSDSKKKSQTAFKKEINAFYKARLASYESRIKFGHFSFDKEVDDYLTLVKNELSLANTNYDFTNVKIVVARYPWPNSFSPGDGVIFINIGLAEYIDNEAQLVFTICHELAHYFLGHKEMILKDIFSSSKKDWFMQKLDETDLYLPYTEEFLRDFLKANILSERHHSSKYELEADELAMELYHNAGFNTQDAIDIVTTLADIQQPEKRFKSTIFSILDIDTTAYEEAVLKVKIISEGDNLNEDLANTYSECDKRIAELKKRIQQGNAEIDPATFSRIKQRIIDNKVGACMDFYEYDRALLHLLTMLSQGYDAKFINSYFVRVAEEVLSARKEHNLEMIFRKPNIYQSKLENDLAQIVYGMRINDLAALIYDYALKAFNDSYEDEETLYSMAKIARFAGKDEVCKEMCEDFLERYPRSEHDFEVNSWIR